MKRSGWSSARWAAMAMVAMLLAACAATPPEAERFSGPTATIADTAGGGGYNRGGVFFTLVQAGDKTVANSLDATRRASFGQGPYLRVVQHERQVLAGDVKLKLLGRLAYAAPIQEIFAAGRLHSVEGVVEVRLEPGTRYRVNGTLDGFRREIWLEEEASQRIVGNKIVALPAADALARSAAAGTFTCCNLRYEDAWIGDATPASMPFVPAGARIRLNDYGRYRANVTIEGRDMSLGLDYGREQQTREQYAGKLIVTDDPNVRINTYPADVQGAIRSGKVMIGMTVEQVIIALGYPRTDLTPSLDAPEWIYMATETDQYTVVWGDARRVKAIEGTSQVKRLVIHGAR